MRELSQIIKKKVIRLFLAGHSYDEISRQLDIAKGSVTNIIDEFRDGELHVPDDMTDYVNELRRIAVDLKKYEVSLNQLRSYQKLYNKLADMGVDSDHVEQWLDLLQIMAASDSSGDKYIDIIGWIADVSAETGKDCSEIIDEYEEVLGYSDYINEEIEVKRQELQELEQKYEEESERTGKQITAMAQDLNRIKQRHEREMNEMASSQKALLAPYKLSQQDIDTVLAAMNDELGEVGISGKERDTFYKKLREAGSLYKIIKQLQIEMTIYRIDIDRRKKTDDKQRKGSDSVRRYRIKSDNSPAKSV